MNRAKCSKWQRIRRKAIQCEQRNEEERERKIVAKKKDEMKQEN